MKIFEKIDAPYKSRLSAAVKLARPTFREWLNRSTRNHFHALVTLCRRATGSEYLAVLRFVGDTRDESLAGGTTISGIVDSDLTLIVKIEVVTSIGDRLPAK